METNGHASPLLLDAADLARELRVSVKTIRRMDSRGRLPRPVRLTGGGRAVRWRREEIESWLAAMKPDGTLPDREEWETIYAA